MKCVICKHGETKEGYTTVTLHRKNLVVIIKEVPASICTNCGEYYLSDEITEKVMRQVEQSLKNGAEIEILRFVA